MTFSGEDIKGKSTMHHRELGATGVLISEVGMGCNRLGEANVPDAHWIELVRRAVDLGVNLFDTSESYGWGRSEEMLGRALEGRQDVLIATKMARIRETGAHDFSCQRMVAQVEGSLRRLRRDVIDIYQLHSPTREALERYDWAAGMAKLKAQGKIRFAAVAVRDEADGIWLMEEGLVDVLQITYNIFHSEPESRLFDLALAKGVGLLCRMPLARGVLTGKFAPDQEVDEGHRALLDGDRMWENIRRAEDLRSIAAEFPGGMTRMALQFSLTPRAVSAVIPGARKISQLEENVAASNGSGLPPDVRAAVRGVQETWS
ncbi:MAG: aldo/keto reductase [Anaerolineae bacterium]